MIELLVVIAIIAILAAILFPVFAQAKEAAKDTTALSNVKNLGTAHILYTADYDDTFCLTAVSQSTRYAPEQNSTWGTWISSIHPYYKSAGVALHPKLTAPSGGQAYWQKLQHWGVQPRAVAVTGTRTWFQWRQGTLTAGRTVRHDGLFGAGIETGQSWYAMVNAPSLSTTAIQNPSTMVMVGEADNWDQWYGVYGQDFNMGWCANWGAGWTATPIQDIFGFHARKRSRVPATGCRYPNGQTIYVAADSSAKSVDFRGQMLAVEAVGADFVHPRMWPN